MKPKDTNLAGAETLIEAFELITGPRNDDYSHPEEDYRRVAQIFHALTGVALDVDQAIMFMVSVKLARLTHNLDKGGWHHDSLVDAAGYLGCLAMVQARREARHA